jgi:hypothetical protein
MHNLIISLPHLKFLLLINFNIHHGTHTHDRGQSAVQHILILVHIRQPSAVQVCRDPFLAPRNYSLRVVLP